MNDMLQPLLPFLKRSIVLLVLLTFTASSAPRQVKRYYVYVYTHKRVGECKEVYFIKDLEVQLDPAKTSEFRESTRKALGENFKFSEGWDAVVVNLTPADQVFAAYKMTTYYPDRSCGTTELKCLSGKDLASIEKQVQYWRGKFPKTTYTAYATWKAN